MSNPSGQVLMQTVVEDKSLPVQIRLQAVREPSYRPTLSFLLRLVRDSATPAKLRAAAIIRYNQQLAIREVTRARRNQRGAKAKTSTPDSAAERA